MELAEQLLVVASAPAGQLPHIAPRPPGEREWLDLQLGWNLVFYLQDRPSPQEAPIPPTPKPGSAEP